MIVVTLCLYFTGSAFGQFGPPTQGTPRQPVFPLDSPYFAQLILDDSPVIVGRLTTVTFLHTLKERPLNGGMVAEVEQDYYRMELTVDRQILGTRIRENNLSLAKVRFWRGGYRVGNTLRAPRVGDQVLVHLVPKDDETFQVVTLSFARPEEVTRLARAAHLLSSPDSRQTAESAIKGCFDKDPHFALGCLGMITDAGIADEDDPRMEAYEAIRQHVTPEKYLEVLWQLLADPETHSLVYVYADRNIAVKTQDAEAMGRRHNRHQRRVTMSETASSSPLEITYRNDELRYLLGQVYSEFPIESRIEILSIINGALTRNPKHPNRANLLMMPSSMMDPTSDELRDALFQFYRDHVPLKDRGKSVVAFHSLGLLAVVRANSDHTESLSHEGLDIWLAALPLANRSEFVTILRNLEQYALHCQNKGYDFKELARILRSLHDTTVNCENREEVTKMLIRLKIEPQDAEDLAL